MIKYTDKEKKEQIFELQSYLRGISYLNTNIPMIVPDGIYGNETKNAVRAFQLEYGLPPTSEVDIRTWEELIYQYDLLTRSYSRPESITAFPRGKDYIVIKGDSGYIVYLIQIMLDTLGIIFNNMESTRINGNYEQDTENSVRSFQSKSGLDITGSVDRDTWDELVKALNSIERGGLVTKQTDTCRKKRYR